MHLAAILKVALTNQVIDFDSSRLEVYPHSQPFRSEISKEKAASTLHFTPTGGRRRRNTWLQIYATRRLLWQSRLCSLLPFSLLILVPSESATLTWIIENPAIGLCFIAHRDLEYDIENGELLGKA